MKKLVTILALLSSTVFFAQAFSGKGDIKFGIGANIQSEGRGLASTLDLGLGENISVGLQSIYLLGVEDYEGDTFGLIENPEFLDRFDIRARFNANLGSVINVSEAFDVYPGLSLGLKNLGAHLGTRYFFTSGFGVFGEFQLPIAKYDEGDFLPAVAPRKELNNQFSFTIGASFNI
jgi:hypothetical protein